MLSFNKYTKNSFYEIFFLIMFIFKQFNLTLIHFNYLKNLNLFFKKLTSISMFCFNSQTIINFNNETKKNKYLNLQTLFKINDVNNEIINDFSLIKTPKIVNNLNIIKINLLNLFFFFNYSYFGKQFNTHFHYNFFYIRNNKNKVIIFNFNKIFLRWNDTYNLLFNIFYYNLNPLLLGSPLFKKEILSLNWQYSNFDINLWRYYFPFFIFKTNKYSPKTDFFFDRISSLGINFFLITDCHFHYKNLSYLKKKNLYTIGLIDVNTQPWIVTYPILTFFESYLTQSFFFKFLLFIDRQVLHLKFNTFKINWFLINFKKISLKF